MTKSELNYRIKALHRNNEKAKKRLTDTSLYLQWLAKTAKPEFITLYYADDTLLSWSVASFRIMLYLNLKHRFISLHNFGLNMPTP